MTERKQAITFDLDTDSLGSLRGALPGWEIETTRGVTARSLDRDWNPRNVDLLVVGARDRVADTAGLCRGLRGQAGRARTTLLVLVPPAQQALVSAVLAAGADGCLVLPVHAKELANQVVRARQRGSPGRHTLGLHRAQEEDPWRDDGGES